MTVEIANWPGALLAIVALVYGAILGTVAAAAPKAFCRWRVSPYGFMSESSRENLLRSRWRVAQLRVVGVIIAVFFYFFAGVLIIGVIQAVVDWTVS